MICLLLLIITIIIIPLYCIYCKAVYAKIMRLEAQKNGSVPRRIKQNCKTMKNKKNIETKQTFRYWIWVFSYANYYLEVRWTSANFSPFLQPLLKKRCYWNSVDSLREKLFFWFPSFTRRWHCRWGSGQGLICLERVGIQQFAHRGLNWGKHCAR